MLKLNEAKRIAKTHGFSSLVTLPSANAKLAKSIGYYNAGISLAQGDLSGHNVCKFSTAQCRKACLGNVGRAEFTPNIVRSRINRTKLLMTDKNLFWDLLEPELHSIDRKATKLGIQVAFRPNILSDLRWHEIMPQMFSTFPEWNFYGYTKDKKTIAAYANGELPSNYHLTYSWNEHSKIDYVMSLLYKDVNVAVPFFDKASMTPTIPEEWNEMTVYNGDESDLRFLDPNGTIVGLSVKLPRSKADRLVAIKGSDGFFVGV